MKKRQILLTLAYDGSKYHGYQVQENALTICEVFQDAVEQVLGYRYDVIGCSRTDTGVHATDYKISLVITHPIPCKGLVYALNQQLPLDIAVLDAQEVPLDFHPRYHAISKEYTYLIHNSPIKDPFTPTQRYRYPQKLDEHLLHQEGQVLLGTHDFSAFCTRAHLVENPVRTLTYLSVTRTGDEVKIVVRGDGFLYNMVRIIVGSLLAVGAGRILPGELKEILASKDRTRAGKTAPPHGLYLTGVAYSKESRGDVETTS